MKKALHHRGKEERRLRMFSVKTSVPLFLRGGAF
jgi:hypothetical protein